MTMLSQIKITIVSSQPYPYSDLGTYLVPVPRPSKNNTRLAWQSILPTKQGLVYVDILVINPMKTAVVGGDFS